jgi:integrase
MAADLFEQHLGEIVRCSAITCTDDRRIAATAPAPEAVEGVSSPIPALPEGVTRLVTQSLAEATRRGYKADLAHYAASGRTIPSTPETVAAYLAEGVGHFAVATMQRRLAAISRAHRAMGVDDPTRAELVRATMAGIRRTVGVAQRQARALLRDDLFAVLDRLGDRPKDVRDRAMLLLGFALAARRSELVALDVEYVEFTAKGALVTIRRSKTDQEARGRQVAVPFGRTRHCPLAALKDWLVFAGIVTGPIFRAMDKHGGITARRISGEAVRQSLKARLADVGYDAKPFSAHSLRSGLVTSAAIAGASSYKIRQVTGHRTEAGLAPYLRAVDLFDDAAISRLL